MLLTEKRSGPGRPRLYARRLSVNVTELQLAWLDSVAEMCECRREDVIRALVDAATSETAGG